MKKLFLCLALVGLGLFAGASIPGLSTSIRNAAVTAGFADAAPAPKDAPGIRERALRGTTLKAVGTSIAANFVYTILLIALVIVLRAAGIDLLSVASSVGPGSH